MTGRSRAALLLMALTLVSCPQPAQDGGILEPETTPPTTEAELEVTSTAFEDGGDIPRKYSCEGDDVSPPLAFGGVPDGATGLAVIVDDPDAPGATFYHWAIWKIPREAQSLAEGTVPPGALQGINDADVARYSGPCPPPPDDAHRYRFTVIAYDGPLAVEAGARASDVLEAAEEGRLARGTLTGLYDR